MDFLLVAFGGGIGAVVRYGIGLLILGRFGTSFPFHTLFINLTGSLAIGLLLVLFVERLHLDPAWRLLVIVGFLGGYTTFSSYTFEALALIEAGQPLASVLYVLGSNLLGLAATLLGMALARSGALH